MSDEISASEEVREMVEDVKEKYGLDSQADVVYGIGSESGDGYLSKTVTVDIRDNKKTLNLFLKYALNVQIPNISLDKVYANEIYFYTVVYPAFSRFAEDKGVQDVLRNVPKCYGSSRKNVVALENLRRIGYNLFDRKKMMDESHIVAVLKAFAKYNGLAMAFKDQEREKYQRIVKGVHNNVFESSDEGFAKMQVRVLENFLKMLDPVRDKVILNSCGNISEKISSYTKKYQDFKDEYSVITKGDCWSNNIMFLYEEEDKTNPTDLMLIDWQIIREGPIVLDLSYFFYTVASKEELKRLKYYMAIYHQELSQWINKLGSDVEVLYPYSVFEAEWKIHSLYGYNLATIVFNAMLVDKEDAVDFEKLGDDIQSIDAKLLRVNIGPENFNRLSNLTEHFVESGFI